MAATPKASWPWARTLLHSVYDQPGAASVHAQYDRLIDAIAGKLPTVAGHLDAARADARAFLEYLVMSGVRSGNPVPSPRRGQGIRPAARGLLGHLGPGRPRGGGRLVRQPRRLPESLPACDVGIVQQSDKG
jgi:hypothetical protein